MYTIPSQAGIALAVVFSISLAGCIGAPARDPLGTPAKTQLERPYPPDFEVRAGVICREVGGRVDFSGAEGYGNGFRCLDVGGQPIEGCVKYDDGRFTYTSPGCPAMTSE